MLRMTSTHAKCMKACGMRGSWKLYITMPFNRDSTYSNDFKERDGTSSSAGVHHMCSPESHSMTHHREERPSMDAGGP